MSESPGTRMSRRTAPPAETMRAPSSRRPWIIGGALAAAVLIVTWILVLPPFRLLTGGPNWIKAGDGSSLVRELKSVPKPPDGFQLASPYYEIRSSQDRGASPSTLTVPLGDGKGGRGLALFTYDNGQWRRLASAEISPDGRSAKGQVDRLPENVAVMRRTSGGFQVQGILPAGTAPHQDADKLLTMRSPADYVPAEDGSLLGAPSAVGGTDAVALVPVVRATEDADVQTLNTLLATEGGRAAHLAALVKQVQTGKLDGLDIEYTRIDPNLGPTFTQFITALAEQLHRTGQTLTVAVPLPRREGNNWNTFGYDLKELGRVADYIRIPPERDQSLYRRTVRDALNFITGQIDARKVILTVSPYAAEKSDQGIRTMTTVEALSIASQISVRDRDQVAVGADATLVADNLNREGGAPGLYWDAGAAAVSFAYQSGDSLRTVWIENVFSVAFKLEFVQLWGLGGVAVDDASDAPMTSNIWPAIDQYQKAGQPALFQPNSNFLKPQWAVDGQNLKIGTATAVWKPQEAGEHTINLTVGDGVILVRNSTKVTVRAGGAPSPSPSGTARPSVSPTPGR